MPAARGCYTIGVGKFHNKTAYFKVRIAGDEATAIACCNKRGLAVVRSQLVDAFTRVWEEEHGNEPYTICWVSAEDSPIATDERLQEWMSSADREEMVDHIGPEPCFEHSKLYCQGCHMANQMMAKDDYLCIFCRRERDGD